MTAKETSETGVLAQLPRRNLVCQEEFSLRRWVVKQAAEELGTGSRDVPAATAGAKERSGGTCGSFPGSHTRSKTRHILSWLCGTTKVLP